MQGDKNTLRITCGLLLAVLALGLGEPRMAAGQVSPQGTVTHGTFGTRTLGQPLTPRPSTFGGGVQTSPGGSFLYLGRADGAAMFATPWRHIDADLLQPVVAASPAAQPGLNGVAGPQLPAPQAAPAPPETNGEPGMSPAEQMLGMTPGGELPIASQLALPQGGGGAAPALPRGTQPYARSPELSDRLTRIARSKGMLAGQGIDVYLSNGIARLQGAVRTPGDSLLLAGVLALEPEVRQIDNRLVAEGPGVLTSK